MSDTDSCPHGTRAEWCGMCRNQGVVYISAGGDAYHARPDCSALLDGQRYVERRGGTPAPIESVPLASDRAAERSACAVCRPTRRR